MKKILVLAYMLCLTFPSQASLSSDDERNSKKSLYLDNNASQTYREFAEKINSSESVLSRSGILTLESLATSEQGEKLALASLIAHDYWDTSGDQEMNRIELFKRFIKKNLTEKNFITFREIGIDFILKTEATDIRGFPDKKLREVLPNLVSRYILEQVYEFDRTDNRARYYFALSRFIFADKDELEKRSFFEAEGLYKSWLKKQEYNEKTYQYQRRFLELIKEANQLKVQTHVLQQTLVEIDEGIRKTEKRIDSCGWLYRLYDKCMSKKYF